MECCATNGIFKIYTSIIWEDKGKMQVGTARSARNDKNKCRKLKIILVER